MCNISLEFADELIAWYQAYVVDGQSDPAAYAGEIVHDRFGKSIFGSIWRILPGKLLMLTCLINSILLMRCQQEPSC